MNQQCICDYSSEEYSEEKGDKEGSNRIFLNFTREYRNPAKDRYNQEKVKELFKYLRERGDLQEMKVSGWLEERDDEIKPTDSDDSEIQADDEEDYMGELSKDDDDDDQDSYYEEKSFRKGGGQRFAMSRDFWYRKLNTLKAQKLDEAALETEDMPPDEDSRNAKLLGNLRRGKVLAHCVPETKHEIYEELKAFEKNVAKPVEKILTGKFVNVYENREYFKNEN